MAPKKSHAIKQSSNSTDSASTGVPATMNISTVSNAQGLDLNQGVPSGAIDASSSFSPMDVDELNDDSAAQARQSRVSIPSSSVVAETHQSSVNNLVQSDTQTSTSLNLGDLTNDNSTVMSTCSSKINVPEEFASSITTDERLILLDEIERLNAAVFRATVASIKCPQGTIVPNNLGVLTRQLDTAQKTYLQ